MFRADSVALTLTAECGRFVLGHVMFIESWLEASFGFGTRTHYSFDKDWYYYAIISICIIHKWFFLFLQFFKYRLLHASNYNLPVTVPTLQKLLPLWNI